MAEPAAATSDCRSVSFTIDGVEVTLRSARGFPACTFSVDEPGAGTQVATSFQTAPFREITLTAIPFGHDGPTEGVRAARRGSAEIARSVLEDARREAGARVLARSRIAAFGRAVDADTSVVMLSFAGEEPRPVLIAEAVFEAGERLWVLRRAEQLDARDAGAETKMVDRWVRDSVEIDAANLDAPTTLQPDAAEDSLVDLLFPAVSASGNLPFPSWWSGNCDSGRVKNGHPLGGSYRGTPACGPNPDLVRTFPGCSWGVYEFECVELSHRLMFLEYGSCPYKANGKDIVNNYPGSKFQKVANDGKGKNLLAAGDIFSSGATSTYGHTGIISSVNVDANGNGTIAIVEQNRSSTGSATANVSGWKITTSLGGTVSGWLHDKSSVSGYVVGKRADGSIDSLIVDDFNRNGGSSAMGTPVNAVHGWGPAEVQDFSGGSKGTGIIIHGSGQSGAGAIWGSFWSRYLAFGGIGSMGYPVNNGGGFDIHAWGAGQVQDYRGGPNADCMLLKGNAVAQPYRLLGAIRSKYLSAGGPSSALKFPVSDEGDAAKSAVSGITGRYQKFEGGIINWTSKYGAFQVFGGMFAKFSALGYSASNLGFPTSDEGAASKSGKSGIAGEYQRFEGGVMNWTQSYGAQRVVGAVLTKYTSLGYSGSCLGFPKNEEYDWSSGRRQDFEGGYIYWNRTNNSTSHSCS